MDPTKSTTDNQIEATINQLKETGVITSDLKMIRVIKDIFQYIPGPLIDRLFQLYTEKKLDTLKQKLKTKQHIP